jgi:hypothetical protein
MKKVFRFIGRYIFNILVSIDQLVNVLMLGSPDETISSRVSRAIKTGNAPKWVIYFGKFIDGLFWLIQRDHIRKSLEVDEDSRGELWRWYK